MKEVGLTSENSLSLVEGVATLIGLGLAMLVLAYYTRAKLVKNTHDFVIAGRKLGFGFGVADLLSVWTWVVGILMPAAVTYSFGLSGLWWFTVPNGLSVVAVVPFARRASLVVATIFGMNEEIVAIISSIVVLVYILLGGLWASMATSTLMALLIMVPTTIVVLATVGHVGETSARY